MDQNIDVFLAIADKCILPTCQTDHWAWPIVGSEPVLARQSYIHHAGERNRQHVNRRFRLELSTSRVVLPNVGCGLLRNIVLQFDLHMIAARPHCIIRVVQSTAFPLLHAVLQSSCRDKASIDSCTCHLCSHWSVVTAGYAIGARADVAHANACIYGSTLESHRM